MGVGVKIRTITKRITRASKVSIFLFELGVELILVRDGWGSLRRGEVSKEVCGIE